VVFVWAVLRPAPLDDASLSHSRAIWLYALSAGLLVIAMVWLWLGRNVDSAARAAQATLFLALAMLPLVRLQLLDALDVRPLAALEHELCTQGVPMVRTTNEPGLLTFLARMPAPLPVADDPVAWCVEHPNGVVLAYSGRGRPPEEALTSARLANGWVALVSARAVINRPKSIDRFGDPSSE